MKKQKNDGFSTILEALDYWAKIQPKKIAYRYLKNGEDHVEDLSYNGVCEQARKIASFLQSKNASNERVVLLLPTSLDYIRSFFGCLYAKAMVVPAYPPRNIKNQPRIEAILEDSSAKFIITTTELSKKIRSWLSEAFKEIDIICIDQLDFNDCSLIETLNYDPNSVAFLQYTSGSTGSPKGVMVTHKNIIANEQMIKESFAHSKRTRVVSWLPFFHDMGLIGCVMQPLYLGGECIFMPPEAFLQKPIRWLNAISKYKGNTSGGPNFAYELCLRSVTSEQKKRLDLSSWKVAYCGAEPIRAAVLKEFAKCFSTTGLKPHALYPCYGLAEATLFITGADASKGMRSLYVDKKQFCLNKVEVCKSKVHSDCMELVSCGLVPKNAKIIIADFRKKKVLPDLSIGEVLFSGESVAKGYWKKTQLSKRIFQCSFDGFSEKYLRTGDLGFLYNGELYIAGRAKELIIINGCNYYPQDIEKISQNTDDRVFENNGAAFIVNADHKEKLIVLQEVKRSAIRKINYNEVFLKIRSNVFESFEICPDEIILLKPLSVPKTSSGKIQRNKAKELYVSGQLKGVLAQWRAKESNNSESGFSSSESGDKTDFIKEWLINKISTVSKLDTKDIDTNAPISSFGFTSLTLSNLIVELSEIVNKELSPAIIYNYPTITLLSDYLTNSQVADNKVEPLIKRGAFNKQNNSCGGDIAIVGMGCRFPDSEDISDFWKNLINGVCAIKSPDKKRQALLLLKKDQSCHGGFLEDVVGFDAGFFNISPKEADSIDPQQRILLEVCWQALENAGITFGEINGSDAGVFIGISNNDYSRLQSYHHTKKNIYFGTGNAFSIAANRLSYYLNIHGPSLAIDTACSSSLVALHLAIKSLKSCESSCAIVGGVNLILDFEINELFSEFGMLSPTGMCRPFADDANGYVRGEGCGVVILKRLEDAITNEDRIFSVIKGSAVNQDGLTNGLTAPNGGSQQKVVQAALNDADVSAKMLTYIEAHGTGTPVGDPIEVTALESILENKQSECFIGSVKANIGHLESAAGIAGLIKATLSLYHGIIPPHINFKAINKHINLRNINIPDKPIQLDVERECFYGVSSFGFGGTNAHVILKSFKSIGKASKTGLHNQFSKNLLKVSAKSEKSLEQMVVAYKDCLKNDCPSFENFCLNANQHRSDFQHRAVFNVKNQAAFNTSAERFLQKEQSGEVFSGYADFQSQISIAMLFTGQGSQYAGMGYTLYEHNDFFRYTIDGCDQKIKKLIGFSIKEILFDTSGSYDLSQTLYTQIGLFVLEYALAQLWISLGCIPEYMIGHSIGELVAACVAEVFSLDDALLLVVQRAQLMASVSESGSMLAVLASEKDVHAVVENKDFTVAVVNSPKNTILSGDKKTINEIKELLDEKKIYNKLLKVSNAFHSKFMEPMEKEFYRAAEKIKYHPPKYKIISNMTGKIVGHEICSPQYWVDHILNPVRFYDGFKTLLSTSCNTVIEIGPRPVLITFGKQIVAKNKTKKNILWLSSMNIKDEGGDEILKGLSELYIQGLQISWEQLIGGKNKEILTLPHYCWDKKNYWFDHSLLEKSGAQGVESCGIHWSKRCWNEFKLNLLNDSVVDNSVYVLFAPLDFKEALRQQSSLYNGKVKYVFPAENYVEIDQCSIGLNPEDPSHYIQLLTTIKNQYRDFDQIRIGHLWGISPSLPNDMTIGMLKESQLIGSESILHIIQGLHRVELLAKAKLTLFSHCILPVKEASHHIVKKLNMQQVGLLGLNNAIKMEMPNIYGGLVDFLELSTAKGCFEKIHVVMKSYLFSDVILLDNDDVYVSELQKESFSSLQQVETQFQNKACLITGGMGFLGLKLANVLAQRGMEYIYLISRSGSTEYFDELEKLKQTGAKIFIKKADVTSYEQMQKVFAEIANDNINITSIFHVAGVLRDNLVVHMDVNEFRSAFEVKALGAWNLHELTKHYKLNNFIMFSSIASLFGSYGQANYCAGNSFLDALAYFRNAQGLPAISINWGPVQGDGMAQKTNESFNQYLLDHGLNKMDAQQAIDSLFNLIDGGNSCEQIAILDCDWNKLIASQIDLIRPNQGGSHKTKRVADLASLSKESIYDMFESILRDIICYPTDHKLDSRKNFIELGLDSISALKLVNKLEEEFNLQIPTPQLFDGRSVQECADQIFQSTSNFHADYCKTEKHAQGITYDILQESDGDNQFYPLSIQQKRIWIEHQLGNRTSYIIFAPYKIQGVFNCEKLEKALNILIEKYEILRTIFKVVNGQPTQIALPSFEFRINCLDVKQSHVGESDSDIITAVKNTVYRDLNIEQFPLLKTFYAHQDDNNHLLIFAIHHLVADGLSVSILMQELMCLYGQDDSSFPLSVKNSLPFQYRDYSRWQSKVIASQPDRSKSIFWAEYLAGYQPLEFDYNYERKIHKTFNGSFVEFELSAEIGQRIKKICLVNKITYNSFFLAAYSLLLHILTAQDDIVIGILTSGRDFKELEKQIGLFFNLLPFRSKLDYARTISEYYAIQKESVFSVLENQDYPIEFIMNDIKVDRQVGRNPIFDTMFIYHNSENMRFKKITSDEFVLYPLGYYQAGSTLDFKMDIFEREGSEFTGIFEYNTSLLSAERAKKIVNDYSRLIKTILDDDGASIDKIVNNFQAVAGKSINQNVAKRVINIGLSANFTADSIKSALCDYCEKFSYRLSCQQAPYDQIIQQLLTSDSVFSDKNDLNVVLLNLEDWVVGLKYGGQESLANMLELITVRMNQFIGALLQLSSDYHVLVVLLPINRVKISSNDAYDILFAAINNLIRAVSTHSNIATLELSKKIAMTDIYDDHKNELAHIPFNDVYIREIGKSILRVIIGRIGPQYKLIVLDCDNTLWGGVVAEDGLKGLKVDEGFKALQKFMLQKFQDGFLLALCSKNNEADVWSIFDNHPDMLLKREHFVTSRINWEPKSANINSIAEELSLDTSSFVFVDDNPAECLEVNSTCSQVLCLPLSVDQKYFEPVLQSFWAFDKLYVTQEDLSRTSMYQAEIERKKLKHDRTNVSGYLKSLDLRLSFCELKGRDVPRASQITQRTNQFNMYVKRRAENEIKALMRQKDCKIWKISVADRFGDYGFVGLVIGFVKAKEFVLDGFMLSCRVLGRDVEKAILNCLVEYCNQNNLSHITGIALETDRNVPFFKFVESTKWQVISQEENTHALSLVVGEKGEDLSHINIFYEKEIVIASDGIKREVSNRTDVVVNHDSIENHKNDDAINQYEYAEKITSIIKKLEIPKSLEGYYLSFLRDRNDSQADKQNISCDVMCESDLSNLLETIWLQELKLDSITLHDNYFALGGTSFNAINICSEIYKRVQINIGLHEIFQYPTISQLTGYLQGQIIHPENMIERVAQKDYYNLSSSQLRIYFLEQMNKNTSYNNPVFFYVHGNIDLEKLQQVICQLVARHESLRTIFDTVDGKPVQMIAENAELHLDIIKDFDGSIDALARSFVQPFDLSVAPLFRVAITLIDDKKYFLLADIHHIISDAYSLRNLIRELIALYDDQNLEKIDLSYKDFSEWQLGKLNDGFYKKDVIYWKDQFSAGVPVLDFPLNYSRPAIINGTGKQVISSISKPLERKMEEFCRQNKVSIHLFLLAIYFLLLSRYTSQEELIVGLPVSGRDGFSLKQIVGVFINTLPFKLCVSIEDSFYSFLSKVKAEITTLYQHQAYPFEKIIDDVRVSRSINRNPFFDTMFDYIELHDIAFETKTFKLEEFLFHQNTSLLDFRLDVFKMKNNLRLVLEFSDELFTEDAMGRFLAHYISFIECVLENPDETVGRLDVLSDDEKKIILNCSCGSKTDKPEFLCFHHYLEHYAKYNPDDIAVIFEEKEYTYYDLNKRANQLAVCLLKNGVKPKDFVILHLKKTFDLLASLFAVLKVGAAYIPVDISYPAKRIKYIIANSSSKYMLSDQPVLAKDTNEHITILNVTDVCDDCDQNNPNICIESDQPMYAIYTSGTTGNPKGVIVTHENVLSLAMSWRQIYNLETENICLLQLASCSFDVFTGDLVRALVNGGSLILCLDNKKLELDYVVDLIKKYHVSIFETVPQYGMQLLHYAYNNQINLKTLRTVIFGSDVFKIKDYYKAREMLEKVSKDVVFFNSYGVTEATIDSTYFEESMDGGIEKVISGNVPIGKPMPNVSTFVLNAKKQLQPIGVLGELYIGGMGVAQGYFKDMERTREKYLPNPFGVGRLYKTGDLARFTQNGILEFFGRNDRQVKIRGYRLELNEIENQLLHYKDITESAIIPISTPTVTSLVAYYVSDSPYTEEEIKAFLGTVLPEYMIPERFVLIPKMPKTPNGKVDYNALPALLCAPIIKNVSKSYTTVLEKEIYGLWCEILNRDDFLSEDNFFDVGGDSISLLVLYNRMKAQEYNDITIATLFSYPTVKSLANYLENHGQVKSDVKSKISDFLDLLDQADPNDIDVEKVFDEMMESE